MFFRASARHQALALGIQGYARNLPDGRVEVLACGTAAAVDAMCEWLHAGPPQAEVSAVDCAAIETAAPNGFSVA